MSRKRPNFRSVFIYLEMQKGFCYEAKDEQLFDWYADGQEVFLQILQNKRISITKRVKPL